MADYYLYQIYMDDRNTETKNNYDICVDALFSNQIFFYFGVPFIKISFITSKLCKALKII